MLSGLEAHGDNLNRECHEREFVADNGWIELTRHQPLVETDQKLGRQQYFSCQPISGLPSSIEQERSRGKRKVLFLSGLTVV